jgi:predicted component of type VI protein secretion system
MNKTYFWRTLCLLGLVVGCSGVTRVSVQGSPEVMQKRIEVVSLLEQVHSLEETNAFGPAVFAQLKEAESSISGDPADVDQFKALLVELKTLKKSQVEKIKSTTAAMAGCIDIPKGFQTSFVRENRKK